MIRSKLLALAVLSCSLAARTAAADTVGPVDDFRGLISPDASAQLRTTGGSGPGGWDVADSVKMVLDPGSSNASLRGAAYATSATPDFSGDVIITTLYGLDPDPLSAALRIGGFNPAAPEITSIFDETIIGNSGTSYSASVALTPTLAELPALLPGFDLSPFEGSPASFLYLFRTAVPGSDLTVVPEPSSLALLVAGTAAAVFARRRRGTAR